MTFLLNYGTKWETGFLGATSARWSARGIGLQTKAILPSGITVDLTEELSISSQEFNQRFKGTPVKRAKRRGYLRNAAVALGNTGNMHALPVLQNALNHEEPLVREHAQWAIEEISKRSNT
jgi:epoxyqueuosine reductase